MTSPFRCAVHEDEMLVDVIASTVRVSSMAEPAGYTLRAGCRKCEDLREVNVVRQLFAVRGEEDPK